MRARRRRAYSRVRARGVNEGHAWTTRQLVGTFALLTCVIAAFWPALHAGFIWDDDLYVTNDLTLRSLDGLRRIWLEPGAVPQYYPLTFTTFWLEYHVWGLDPFGYHLVNVLLHSINALLVWRLLDRLGIPGAYLAGLIFAVHPMQVESVAWVTERKNVLSGFFYLLALGAYLRVMGLDRAGPSHRPGLRLEIVALILFAFALLSKTVTMTLPGVIALLIVWKRGRVERHELVRLSVPLALGLILSLHTAIIEKVNVGATGREFDLSFAERLLVAGRALWFYLGKLVWPRDVPFIYPRWTLDPSQWWQWCFPVAAVLVGVLLFAWRRSIGSEPFVAAVYYAGTLVPALGFFSVYPMRFSFVANHFAYLATIGPIAFAASAGARLAPRVPRAPRESLRVGAAILILILVVLSNGEARNYRDLRTLWTSTIAGNPDCFICHNNLGFDLENTGRTAEAMAEYEFALRLKPDFAEGHYNLGNVLAGTGHLSEAIAQYEAALLLEPDYVMAHNNLGTALVSAGRLPEAIAQFEKGLRLRPDSAEFHSNLGNALISVDRIPEAIAEFEEALRLKPDAAELHRNLGNALMSAGRIPEATVQFEQALRLKPDSAEFRSNLVGALARPEAIAQFEEALRLKPDSAELHSNLGNALMGAGRIPEAIAQFEEALRLKPDFAGGRIPEVIAHLKDELRLQQQQRRSDPSSEAGGAP